MLRLRKYELIDYASCVIYQYDACSLELNELTFFQLRTCIRRNRFSLGSVTAISVLEMAATSKGRAEMTRSQIHRNSLSYSFTFLCIWSVRTIRPSLRHVRPVMQQLSRSCAVRILKHPSNLPCGISCRGFACTGLTGGDGRKSFMSGSAWFAFLRFFLGVSNSSVSSAEVSTCASGIKIVSARTVYGGGIWTAWCVNENFPSSFRDARNTCRSLSGEKTKTTSFRRLEISFKLFSQNALSRLALLNVIRTSASVPWCIAICRTELALLVVLTTSWERSNSRWNASFSPFFSSSSWAKACSSLAVSITHF